MVVSRWLFRKGVFGIPLILALTLFSASARQQSAEQPSTSNSADVAARVVNMTRTFLAGHSSISGVTVTLHEYSRTEDQGKTVVRYHAFVHGPVTSGPFSLFSWPINLRQPAKIIDGVTLGPDGIVMCAGRVPGQCGSADKPDDPVNLTFAPALAEPVRLALISDDQKTTILFGIVPEPLVKSAGRCTIEAVRLLPAWQLVLIRATGFEPGEALHFSSQSYREKHNEEVKADSSGAYASALMPFVQTKASGETKVEVRGSACATSLSFDWGTP